MGVDQNAEYWPVLYDCWYLENFYPLYVYGMEVCQSFEHKSAIHKGI